MDYSKQSPTCISFCYGIGGLDNGLEKAIGDLIVLVIVEIEAVAIANVVAKIEAGRMAPTLIYTNAKSFPAHLFRDKVDWFIGGYPCQPFSHAGKRGGVDDPRHLFPHFERSIIAMRPLCCLFENVAGHLTLGFPEVYRSLRKMGYVVEAGIFSAEEVGAPHQRERLFILAIREDIIVANRDSDESRYKRGRIQGKSKEVEGAQQREERNKKEWQWSWPFSGNDGEMEKSGRIGVGRVHTQRIDRRCEVQTERSGELVDAAGERTKRRPRKLSSPTEELKAQEESRQKKAGLSKNASELGDTNITRLQGRESRVCEECTCEWTSRSYGPYDRLLRWPAGPGQQQHEWESPRTVITDEAARLLGGYSEKYPESFLQWQVEQVAKDGFASQVKPSLGCATDGYDFREDFLRALGNAVCPPQAKRAIEILLKKF